MHAPTQQPDTDTLTGRLSSSAMEKEGRQARRIAHIDDDPDIRDTVRRILTASGYSVDSYETMNDFTASLRACLSPPDLAILDVMVETMDAGLETYVDIRRHFPRLDMIFMTSLGEEIRPYFSGISDEWILIVEKPVEPDSFLSMVRSRLDHSEP